MNTAMPRRSITYSSLERCRWNIIDLITTLGRKALPVTIFFDVDMTYVHSLKKKSSALGLRLTETAVLLKAIAIAQRQYPASRSVYLPWGQIATFENIAAGFTVERFVESIPAVFLGTVDDPANKPLQQIMSELNHYSKDSLESHPQLNLENRFSKVPWILRQIFFQVADLSPWLRMRSVKATFGVSSLGKYGVKAVTGPCICTSTFGVGQIEERAVVKDDQIVVRPMMTLSLVFDQRCMDGGMAAQFLKDVKELLEGGLDAFLTGQT
jgi:pyruvate/2-oxoglutarate dehydrogenase complex dihydrolipoamide acyltransferase (E2) component